MLEFIKKNRIKIFGIFLIVFGCVFICLETEYFGNNFLPKSKEEFLCDFAGLLICLSGHIVYKSKKC